MKPMPRRLHRTVLTAHIIVSVGLLGDSMGFLAVAIRAATTPDPAVAEVSRETLEMFGLVFGIPLSVLSIATGVTLGLGTKWGVFRYPWVTLKLALIVSVMVVGALVIGPNTTRDDRDALLVAGGAYQVLALSTATTLSVFKPGSRRARRRPGGRALPT